jgi:hypothetical protein
MQSTVTIPLDDYEQLKAGRDDLQRKVNDLTQTGEWFAITMHQVYTRCGTLTINKLDGYSKDEAIQVLRDEVAMYKGFYEKELAKNREAPSPIKKRWFFLLLPLFLFSCSKPSTSELSRQADCQPCRAFSAGVTYQLTTCDSLPDSDANGKLNWACQ